MGRRGRGSRGRQEGRGRVKDRVQSRVVRGGRGRGPSFDVGGLEGVARRLAEHGGGASTLAGAASGLAGGGLAGRFLGEGAGESDEDFRREVMDRLSLLDERLLRLEEQMGAHLGETPEEPADPTGPVDPSGNR